MITLILMASGRLFVFLFVLGFLFYNILGPWMLRGTCWDGVYLLRITHAAQRAFRDTYGGNVPFPSWKELRDQAYAACCGPAPYYSTVCDNPRCSRPNYCYD